MHYINYAKEAVSSKPLLAWQSGTSMPSILHSPIAALKWMRADRMEKEVRQRIDHDEFMECLREK